MSKITLLIIVLLLVLIVGCGNKNEVSGEKKDEAKQESLKDEKNESQESKDELREKEEANPDQSKEDAAKTNELGMIPGMPNNFPSDVPRPKNAKTLGSLNSSEGTVVTFESTDNVQDIVNFYKEELKKNGYSISEDGETLVSDKGGLISWKKDNKEVGLMLGYDKDRNITSLVITYK